jgi:integrase
VARPRTPIGTFGEIEFTNLPNGNVRARVRFRDYDGQVRRVEASDSTRKLAEHRLKEKLAQRSGPSSGTGELTADSSFTRLVEVWLGDLDLEGKIALSTRALYERNMRQLVMPAFEHFTLREITVSRVDQFIKTLATTKSYSTAKQARTVLSLALGLAVRYEALAKNPVRDTVRLRKPPSTAMALTVEQVEAIRRAVRSWRRESGLAGPKPDGQLEQIIEVMLGTSARIGEVLAICKCDVDVTKSPATVRICGTIVSPAGKPSHRQGHPKTSKSTRTVFVPSFTAEALRERLVVVASEDLEHLIFFSRKPHAAAHEQRPSPLAKGPCRGRHPGRHSALLPTYGRHGHRPRRGADLAAEMLGHTSSEITRQHYIEPNEQVNPVTAEILEALAPRRRVELGDA